MQRGKQGMALLASVKYPSKPSKGGESGAQRPRSSAEGAPAVSATEQTVREAMNALSPEAGIKRLQACLAGLKEVGAASRVYWALGTLYGQLDPPDIERAMEALQTAAGQARSAEDRHRAALSLAGLLAQKGDRAQAEERIRSALEYDKMVTLPGLQLEILLGKLYEDDGANEAAEAAYKNAVDDAAAAGVSAANIYRQACLSLARFYRKLGRDADADALARVMKTQLDGAKAE